MWTREKESDAECSCNVADRGRFWMTLILALFTFSVLLEMRCPSTSSSHTMKWDFSQLNTSHFMINNSRIIVK